MQVQGTSKLEIRRAGAAEAPAIAGVLHAAFAEYEAAYTPGGFAATTPAAEQIRARLDEGPIWVAVRDGAVVGTVGAVIRGEAVYMRGMAALPAVRGHGVGRVLLREVEDFARSVGAQHIWLSTTPFLTGAIHLYEQGGFRRTADPPHDLFGTPLFTMVKPLV